MYSVVLGAAVAMEDGAARRALGRGRQQHGAGHERSASAGETPSEDTSGVLVHYHRQVAPAGAHLEKGDIANPHLARAGHLRRPEAIGMPCIELVDVHFRAIPLNGLGA
jgi:hypothetical protein